MRYRLPTWEPHGLAPPTDPSPIGSSAPTTFQRPVLIVLGAGNEVVGLVGYTDANQELIVLSTYVIHRGTGDLTTVQNPAQMIFPFGTSIQSIL